MKKLLLVALMGFGSTAAFANFSVYEGSTDKDKKDEKKFECRFRSQDKKGLRCEVRAEVQKDKKGGEKPNIIDRNKDEAKLSVRCNNGFDLFDRDARSDSDDDVLRIKGRDRGEEATLKIKLDRHGSDDIVDRHDRDDEFRAWLEIEGRGGREIKLRGRCEERERDGHDGLELQ